MASSTLKSERPPGLIWPPNPAGDLGVGGAGDLPAVLQADLPQADLLRAGPGAGLLPADRGAAWLGVASPAENRESLSPASK